MKPATGLAAAIGLLLCLGKAQAACEQREHQQFDFWIGEWEVSSNGQYAGHNRISREIGGCVLHEHYSGKNGYYGESFNSYDSVRGLWHQTWIDNGGQLLLLDGKLINGVMELSGRGVDGKGQPLTHRIRWSKNADGSVRQLWESSSDGKQWQIQFDGLYRKKPAPTP